MQTKSWSVFGLLSALIIGVFTPLNVQAATVEFFEGPVHEAYLNTVTDSVVVQSVPTKPPAPIRERQPQQVSSDMVWIPGYWSWDQRRDDYIWISGIWRKKPAGRIWVPGVWQEFKEGYAYLPGFWSRESEHQMIHAQQVPPAAVEERNSEPPSDGYFWAAGYWKYNNVENNYGWHRGHWEKLDRNLIYVPGQYYWRTGGYVFVPPYWDWRLEERGQTFQALWIPKSARSGYVIEPTETVSDDSIVLSLFTSYPDYLYFFNWHYHFHPEFWISQGQTPPWWSWNGWWSLNWTDSWAVWWWWSHPGYPAPRWITPKLADKIAPPGKALVLEMKNVRAPLIVTRAGVLTGDQIIAELPSAGLPVLPSDKRELGLMVRRASSQVTGGRMIRPQGRIAIQAADLPKPKFPKVKGGAARPSEIAEVPEKPSQSIDREPYRVRPGSDEGEVKPAIRQPVFPSRRPKFDEPRDTTPRNVFSPTLPDRPLPEREKYEPPKVEDRTNPYAPDRRVYEPKRPDYEVPRDTYRPSIQSDSLYRSNFSDDLYSPPASGSFTPKESIRTRTRRGRFYRPSVNTETPKEDPKAKQN